MFNRAHVDDIAELTRLVLTRGLEGQIWNVADDEPAPPQDVVAYAAALLGLPPPPEEPFDEARLSSMTAEFYADNKRVSIAKAKTILGFAPAYPTYREGLRRSRRLERGGAREGEARPSCPTSFKRRLPSGQGLSAPRERRAAELDLAQAQCKRHRSERKQHQHPKDVHVGEI